MFRRKYKKYITFSVPIKKELDNGKLITYKIRFIDSFRSMSRSLPNPTDNLSERFNNNKCIDCKSYPDYMATKDDQRNCIQLVFRCFECKNNYKKEFNKEDVNKFVLLLTKGIYLYEYMDSWERFDETSLPDKAAFYSSLNMENITDIDYSHTNKVFKKLKVKNLGDYHDLYVQSDTSDTLETCVSKYMN